MCFHSSLLTWMHVSDCLILVEHKRKSSTVKRALSSPRLSSACRPSVWRDWLCVSPRARFLVELCPHAVNPSLIHPFDFGSNALSVVLTFSVTVDCFRTISSSLSDTLTSCTHTPQMLDWTFARCRCCLLVVDAPVSLVLTHSHALRVLL